MAKYIKGDAVPNATSYELFRKNAGDYISLSEAESINFNLDELNLGSGNHILVVKAKAAGYLDSDYSNEIEYYELIRSPLIDIDMTNGYNIGKGNEAYNVALHGGASFENGVLNTTSSSYATIPTGFITSKTSQFTAFFVFDDWTADKIDSELYGWFFRFTSDVPNTYLVKQALGNGKYAIRFKLLNNVTTTAKDVVNGTLSYVNTDILKCESTATSGKYYWYYEVEEGEKLAIAVRCDGTNYSYWKDGILVCTSPCTNTTPNDATWTNLEIGGALNTNKLTSLQCSKVQMWNEALTDNEMATLTE